ncbi:MAG: DNA polymerase III subunit gamma/tau [Ruminococcus sp.]|nr:DNA polymerase III subunit gamma/tau [Ruminococcus sp.]
MYQVLYRKWRPQTFDDVAGQEHITATLKNELQNNRLNHAYLFTGSRGTGKTTCAKILAKAANCLSPKGGNPCGECEICKGIDSGDILDILEMDAASNRKIENIRDIIDEVQFKPAKCRYRVYIVDEVHMLTTEAFNALLKTLEEPPEHVIFILATTEVHKLPQTILSRCQRFDFHRIPPRVIADRLLYVAEQEQAQLSESAAMLIASVADGALRDALSLLDRCIAVSPDIDEAVVRNAAGLADKGYLFDLAVCVINKNTARALEQIDRLYSESKDMARLCDELIAHFRALMLIKSLRDPRAVLVMSDDEFEQAKTQCDYLSLADIVYYMDVLSRAYQRMGRGTGDRTELEMAMVTLSSPELDVTNEATAARITALEKAVKRGFSAAPQTPQPIEAPEEKPAAHTEETVSPKQQEQPPREMPEEKPKEATAQDKQSENTEAPKQRPQTTPRQTEPDYDAIYRNAKPFPGWVDVVDALKSVSRTIAAAFTGTTAYESGNYLLIDSESEMAFELLRLGSQRQKIREIVREVTGRVYRLGPYRRPQQKQETQDPMQSFRDQLKDSGIEVTEE